MKKTDLKKSRLKTIDCFPIFRNPNSILNLHKIVLGEFHDHTYSNIKTKHSTGSEEETEFLKAGIALGKLPMVKNFQCFKKVSEKNEYEFGFSMEFKSQLEYDVYNGHWDHVEFVENRWKSEVKKSWKSIT